jgi:hypothetical protein
MDVFEAIYQNRTWLTIPNFYFLNYNNPFILLILNLKDQTKLI